MNEDEDEELFEIEESKFSKFKRLYITEVFKTYGWSYAMLIAGISLCYVIVLLPATLFLGYKSICKLIEFLSHGNQNLFYFYWTFLITSIICIIAVWLTNKICDIIELRKKHKKTSH